jgi:hypothetical protein
MNWKYSTHAPEQVAQGDIQRIIDAAREQAEVKPALKLELSIKRVDSLFDEVIDEDGYAHKEPPVKYVCGLVLGAPSMPLPSVAGIRPIRRAQLAPCSSGGD